VATCNSIHTVVNVQSSDCVGIGVVERMGFDCVQCVDCRCWGVRKLAEYLGSGSVGWSASMAESCSATYLGRGAPQLVCRSTPIVR
jgi:hypothetical protein